MENTGIGWRGAYLLPFMLTMITYFTVQGKVKSKISKIIEGI